MQNYSANKYDPYKMANEGPPLRLVSWFVGMVITHQAVSTFRLGLQIEGTLLRSLKGGSLYLLRRRIMCVIPLFSKFFFLFFFFQDSIIFIHSSRSVVTRVLAEVRPPCRSISRCSRTVRKRSIVVRGRKQ